jgi:hypothetical protein
VGAVVSEGFGSAEASLFESLQVAGSVLGAMVWQFGAGVGDERILYLDDPAEPYGVMVSRTETGWMLVAHVEEEQR